MTNKLMSMLNETWYQVTLPVLNKKIEIRPYNMKANQSIAEVYEESENKDDISFLLNGLVNIVELCIKPDEDGKILNTKKLHIADFIFLSNKLRAISKGSKMEYRVDCNEMDPNVCGEKQNIVEFDIDDYEIINLNNPLEIVLSEGFSEKLTIVMKKFTVESIFDNPKMIQKATSIHGMMEMLSFFMESIIINEQILESNFEEKLELLLNMTEIQLKPLVKWFEGMTRLVLKKEFNCKKCGKTQEIIIDDMAKFLN